MNNILILGGAGFLGSDVCEKLVERTQSGDARIVTATRHPGRSRPLLALPMLELETCDVHDDDALRQLVRGRDAVINLVGILHGSERDFQRAHVDLPRRLVDACAAAGVRRVVHVSALGASSNAPSRYLRSKAAGEAALRHREVEWTVLRPSVIFGAEDCFINRFASLQSIWPLIPLACAGAKFQPVWVEDVANAIVQATIGHAAVGQIVECAGPSVYTLKELMQLAGRWSGHERPIVALPDSLARLQAWLLECLPGEPLMSRDNLDSMKVPNVASGSLPGLASLGITPHSMESVMPALMSHRFGPRRFGPMRAHAHGG
jgi:NADH dehydrogenase